MLKLHTNESAKPPKASRGKHKGPRQLSLWGTSLKTASKTATALDKHSLNDVAVLWTSAAKKLDLEGLQTVEARSQALAGSVLASAAAEYGKLKDSDLGYPADVAAYLVLRELDEKGRREVPEHRLKVIDFGIKALIG